MARPTKYTSERVERVLAAIRVGATQRLAAAYAGVDQDTVIAWRLRYPDFSDAFKSAEGAAGVQWLAKIEAAANDGAWQAAAWKLERRYPHEYGRQAVEVTGRDGGPIHVNANLDAARKELEERLDRIAATLASVSGNTDADADA